ncbi:MAG: serine/threonine protein kinase, partial [Pseudomonadota bacterium]|nr:serine/threonine protein kinase [Pseudomonadota bacterium]
MKDMPNNDAPLPQIKGYRLLRVINHGGMSIVYLGEQLALSREVAIKVMQPQALSDEVSRRRFENEVRTIARLEHPHVVRIYELGRTSDGLPYYTMPHLARGHLGLRSFKKADGEVDEKQVVAILRTLLSALEYAHSRGVVHRDVKAENVLFDDTEQPLLADFGIALRRGFGPRVTAAGLAVGSTAYMAPEQARGEDVDGRADLYSLGVLAWEMVTGELPFRAADALSMAVMHAQDPVPRLAPEFRHWQRFMNRALAKLPAERFQDVPQMRSALGAIEHRRSWPRLAKWRDKAAAAARPGRRTLWLGLGAA